MKGATRKALVEAGFRVGDAADFLGLTEDERRIVELRAALSRGIHELRIGQKLTQRQLAVRMKTSQPRVAKIEAGAAGVSLDQMVRCYFALGGSLTPSRTESRARAKVRAKNSNASGVVAVE